MDSSDSELKRREKDGFVYFGCMSPESTEDQLTMLDFNFPSNNNEQSTEENKINM